MNLEFYILYADIFFLIIFFGISFYNYLNAPRIKNTNSKFNSNKSISILIPARNEEANIKNCVNSVLNQSYKNFELFVLDDESNDNTYNIVKKISDKNEKVKLIKGKSLPENWIGKNWACHQLSEKASGDILLFIDADVELKQNALYESLNLFESNNLNMLSCFPTQKIRTFGEWLIVPLMNFFLLNLLPLLKVFSSPNKSFVAANGQFLMFDKPSYKKISGHNSVKNKVVEDMELARLYKQNKLSVLTALGDKNIYCNMYNSFSESFNGFSKNFFPGFSTNFFIFVLFILFLVLIYIIPFFFLTNNLFYLLPITLIVLIRIFISLSSRQNVIYNILLHPFQIILMFLVGINSVWQNKITKPVWKGRKI